MTAKELADFLPEVARRYRRDNAITRNSHMHRYDGPPLPQAAIDAVLVCFINEACRPLDLGLYAADLEREERYGQKCDGQ